MRSCRLLFCSFILSIASEGYALNLDVKVLTHDNKPLSEAVVYVDSPGENVPVSTQISVMDQQNKAFVPHVLAVPVGTTVEFPNTDTVNHYVYSFSEIKKFQFKLFKGDLEKHQMQFDNPGIVTLGCNIHDFMLGYIFVAPTPYVGVSDNFGKVHLNVPDKGNVTIAIWHERNNENLELLTKKIILDNHATELQIKFSRPLKPQRRMSHDGSDY